uniref:Uncharacterized protein n=1 Tax=Pseudo-nitzschia australis TaxID=44445 RepID=A0A7S4EHB0_9STRA
METSNTDDSRYDNADDDYFDDDDDDAIVLVSSTRQKWEKLHGIHTIANNNNNNIKSKSSDDDEGISDKDSSDEQTGRIRNSDRHQEEEEDEDEILVVAVRPTQSEHAITITITNEETSCSRRFSVYSYDRRFQICVLFVAIALSIGIKKRFHTRKKRRAAAAAVSKPTIGSNNKRIEETTAAAAAVAVSNSSGKNNFVGRNKGENATTTTTTTTIAKVAELVVDKTIDDDGAVLQSSDGSKSSRNEQQQKQKQKQQQQGELLETRQISVTGSSPSSSMLSKTQTVCESSDLVTADQQQQTRQDEKLEMAQQFAQDIRLVQDVLVEHSLDPSMAPQLAMSLQTSQKIIESQRDLSYQTAMLDAHHRQLDRQLSQKQHLESLKCAKYDPNWREKLQAMRDQSYYWNLSNGGFGRLWWEVVLIQQVACGVVPVWQYYYNSSSSFYQWNGRGTGNANVGNVNVIRNNSNSNEHILFGLVTSFLKDSVASILTEVCDCRPTQTSTSTSTGQSRTAAATTLTSTSWIQSTILSWIVVPTTFTASSLFSPHTTGSILPGLVEYWSCYGYCLLSTSMLLVLTIVFHQGLRILSVPSFLHHIVNLVSTALFYGPQRTLALVFTTVMRMLMVLPSSSDRDNLFNSINDEQQPRSSNSSGNNNTMMGCSCSFLLLSLWVVLPIVSWIRTPALCRQVESCVIGSDPIDFECALQKGRARLKRWQWEQIATRYLLLSLYSALILWENNSSSSQVL